MSLLEAISSAFINTFGITQPDATTRRRAAWFIVGMMILVAAFIVAVGVVLVRIL